MNRRSFITSLLAGVIAPAILPGAGRVWKRTEALWVPNPKWETATHECILHIDEYPIWYRGDIGAWQRLHPKLFREPLDYRRYNFVEDKWVEVPKMV